MKRRSKTNPKFMKDIQDNDGHRVWRNNPNCQFKELVQKIEQQKRLECIED